MEAIPLTGPMYFGNVQPNFQNLNGLVEKTRLQLTFVMFILMIALPQPLLGAVSPQFNVSRETIAISAIKTIG